MFHKPWWGNVNLSPADFETAGTACAHQNYTRCNYFSSYQHDSSLYMSKVNPLTNSHYQLSWFKNRNERMNEWKNELTNERENERTRRRTSERTNEWTNEWTNERTNEQEGELHVQSFYRINFATVFIKFQENVTQNNSK